VIELFVRQFASRRRRGLQVSINRDVLSAPSHFPDHWATIPHDGGVFVERAGPPARGRAEYFDASFPGLALRVTDRGVKSWSVLYRLHGRLRRFTIGN
jgi:hypothetical protein